MRLLSAAWSAVHSVQHEEVLGAKTMGCGTTDQVTDVPICSYSSVGAKTRRQRKGLIRVKRKEYTTGSRVLHELVGVPQPEIQYGRRTELTNTWFSGAGWVVANCCVDDISSGCTVWPFGPVSESAHRKLEAITLLNGSADRAHQGAHYSI